MAPPTWLLTNVGSARLTATIPTESSGPSCLPIRDRPASASRLERLKKSARFIFPGGTDNPDGDTGIGFDGKPSQPSPMTFAWNLRAAKWEVVSEATPNPTMNNHGLLVIPEMLAVAGGLEKGQVVTRRVTVIPDPTKAR